MIRVYDEAVNVIETHEVVVNLQGLAGASLTDARKGIFEFIGLSIHAFPRAVLIQCSWDAR